MLAARGVCTPLTRALASWAATASSSFSTASPARETVVLTLPQLSPSMKTGLVSKYLKGQIPGDAVEEFDVVMEVETEQLTEEAYRVGDFAGRVTLLVEAQEEGVLEEILVPEGREVPVGTPVARLSQEALFGDSDGDSDDTEQPMAGREGADGQPAPREMSWQSYLKEGRGSGGCS